jgi:hypothetical protein
MNYRTHISVPSSNRVEVSAAGHPEFSRLIELPREAPREWLAYAYLLSIGMDPEAQRLDDLEPPVSWAYDEWDPYYGPRATYASVSHERMRLPGLHDELQLAQQGEFQPKVGDQKVAVFPTEQTTSPDLSTSAWQVSPPPFRPDAVNQELARKYGVVLPHFNASALEPDRYGYGRTTLIDSLLAELSPVRRIALRAHLDGIGLLDKAESPDDDIPAAAEPLLRLLAGIGPDGVAQDSDTGWLPPQFASDLASEFDWEEEGTADAPVQAMRGYSLLAPCSAAAARSSCCSSNVGGRSSGRSSSPSVDSCRESSSLLRSGSVPTGSSGSVGKGVGSDMVASGS